jgi:hypothetical protein
MTHTYCAMHVQHKEKGRIFQSRSSTCTPTSQGPQTQGHSVTEANTAYVTEANTAYVTEANTTLAHLVNLAYVTEANTTLADQHSSAKSSFQLMPCARSCSSTILTM